MTTMSLENKSVIIYQGDISDRAYEYYSNENILGMDTETNGLSPERNDLQLIQITSRDNKISLVQFKKSHTPKNINKLLSDKKITKVFHYSPFDLKFLGAQANSSFENIFCTKAASQKVRGQGPKGYHKLNTVAKEVLGVDLDKSLMDPNNLPDWTGTLTDDHIEYATGDVLVLIPLYDYFVSKLTPAILKQVYADSLKVNTKYY